MPDQTTQAVELAGRLEEESLGLQQLAWSRADGGQYLSIAANLMDEAAALLRIRAERIGELEQDIRRLRLFEIFAIQGRQTAVYLNRRCTGPEEGLAEDVFDAVQCLLTDGHSGRNPAGIETPVPRRRARAALQPTKSPPLKGGRETGGEG